MFLEKPIRPLYESQSDRVNEKEVITKLETAMGHKFHKLPMDYRVDYSMTYPGYTTILGWCEIKCRNNTSDKYPTLMLSLKKFSEGLRLSELTMQPFYIFIQYTDKLMYYKANRNDNLIYMVGGRTVKTRDPQDIEPCVYIPKELMKEVVNHV
jgi:hypothetical protein